MTSPEGGQNGLDQAPSRQESGPATGAAERHTADASAVGGAPAAPPHAWQNFAAAPPAASGNGGGAGSARGDFSGTLERVLDRVMGNQRDSMVYGFSHIEESLGRGAGGGRTGGRLDSTINVEPRMPWPEFGDKHKSPQETEDFVRQFESICRMANKQRRWDEV